MTTDERVVELIFADVDHIFNREDFLTNSSTYINEHVRELWNDLNTTRYITELLYPDNKDQIAELQLLHNILYAPFSDSLNKAIQQRLKIEKLNRII